MVQFCILGNIEKTHTAQYNKTIESNGHMNINIYNYDINNLGKIREIL